MASQPNSGSGDEDNDFQTQPSPQNIPDISTVIDDPAQPNVPFSTGAPNPNSWNGAQGWYAYFPDAIETDKSCKGRAEVVHRLTDFFSTEHGHRLLTAIPADSFALPLDYQHLRHRSSPSVLRGIAAALRDNPDDSLASIGLSACRAAERVAATSSTNFALAQDLPVSRENRLWPRMYNFSTTTSIGTLRGNSVGKFIAIKGTVVRVSNIRQQLVSMEFECGRCGEKQARAFTDYKYSAPTRCPTDKCRSRNFTPLRSTAETVDWQKIRVQELQNKDDDSVREEGRIPRTIDAELFADLIDTVIPGDIVTVCGVVRVLTIEGGAYQKSGKCLYYMYLEANSTDTNRNKTSANISNITPVSRQVEETETLAIHKVIREVVREKDPFGFLVHSAVPSIYGHEIVKAGMLLSLFGGAAKERIGPSGSETISIRRDIHCLIVGDPGLGKSQMLKGFSNIAPRGVYVCGNTTSTAGLTVTVVRESSGDFALEAGALVLGDRGVCCIDEFDKMGAEHGSLLEAMEQQSVSVAKAGLLCNLSARTTVIAAANPVGGHYDRSRTVCENLKIALPLLSRFDLVFILMDKADEARDRFISEHVMKMFGMRSASRGQPASSWRSNGNVGPHARVRRSSNVECNNDGTQQESGFPSQNDARHGEHKEKSLVQRLRNMRVNDPLPPGLFRQYVSYARTHVHPELSEGAKREFQEFYLKLRRTAQEHAADTTPITTRQLESLIRLGEARSRSVMRTVVTAEDARDVIEIMQESMLETLTDETGVLDLGRSSGMSKSKEAKKFIAALHSECRRRRNALFDRRGLRNVAERIGITGERFETILETVNYQGYLMKKGTRMWEVQGSTFGDGGGSGCGSANQANLAAGLSQRSKGTLSQRKRNRNDEGSISDDDYGENDDDFT